MADRRRETLATLACLEADMKTACELARIRGATLAVDRRNKSVFPLYPSTDTGYPTCPPTRPRCTHSEPDPSGRRPA